MFYDPPPLPSASTANAVVMAKRLTQLVEKFAAFDKICSLRELDLRFIFLTQMEPVQIRYLKNQFFTCSVCYNFLLLGLISSFFRLVSVCARSLS